MQRQDAAALLLAGQLAANVRISKRRARANEVVAADAVGGPPDDASAPGEAAYAEGLRLMHGNMDLRDEPVAIKGYLKGKPASADEEERVWDTPRFADRRIVHQSSRKGVALLGARMHAEAGDVPAPAPSRPPPAVGVAIEQEVEIKGVGTPGGAPAATLGELDA